MCVGGLFTALETTVSCEQIFRQLVTTANKLEETEKNRHITFDGDLIWLYFKLEPKLAIIVITLALAHIKDQFKSVELQSSTRLTKILTKEVSCLLSKQFLLFFLLFMPVTSFFFLFFHASSCFFLFFTFSYRLFFNCFFPF